jgi:hypothetical protein
MPWCKQSGLSGVAASNAASISLQTGLFRALLWYTQRGQNVKVMTKLCNLMLLLLGLQVSLLRLRLRLMLQLSHACAHLDMQSDAPQLTPVVGPEETQGDQGGRLGDIMDGDDGAVGRI